MPTIVLKEKKKDILFIGAVVMAISMARVFKLNFYLQLGIYSLIILLAVYKIVNKVQASKDKKKWYLKIGIGLFFILLSVVYAIYNYYQIPD